ncbi:MAG: cysteine--tRNA ligase [Oscillospiraceae bacterium]|nr:cysteine--tRNA ligase [Oscillospiraceae bacterium]MBR2806502.1 cysteine--tRNA ligase [Oscillospiraceae bacterium]
MKIFNTMAMRKVELVPRNGELKIYACGPTVYNFIHIGNARALVAFDTFRRYLEYSGIKVTFVQNFTDIDDKMINKANEEGVTVKDIADRYIAEYWKDADGLNVRRATVHPKATENIDEILSIIDGLVKKGHAYVAENGDVYFRTRSFREYGKLSGQRIDDLEAGKRIEVGDVKEDPLDFAVWKATKPGEPSWPSPYGEGRPGWHIECSAMARRYLGDTIDIHCGGKDLVFPHHENEIAQSECCNGVPFSRYWMHNGFINVDGNKMSKSLNNFFLVRDVANQFGYEPIRYFLISAHYRKPLNYTVDLIEQSRNALDRLYNCRDNLDYAISVAPETGDESLAAEADKYMAQYREAMDDDVNTADALAALFELTRVVNSAKDQSKASLEHAAKIYDDMCWILGILYNRKKDEIPEEVKAMAEQRQEARKARNFALADELRNKITEMGYTIEDTPEGPKIVKK